MRFWFVVCVTLVGVTFWLLSHQHTAGERQRQICYVLVEDPLEVACPDGRAWVDVGPLSPVPRVPKEGAAEVARWPFAAGAIHRRAGYEGGHGSGIPRIRQQILPHRRSSRQLRAYRSALEASPVRCR